MKNYKTIVLLILSLIMGLPSELCAQDTANGIIWYPAIQLSDSAHDAYQPRIALSDDDTVHVTWWGDMRLPYARSTNGGGSFEATREMLTDSTVSSLPSEHPYIVASGQSVYLFFVNSDQPFPYGSRVHMYRSTDGGTTFGSVQDISQDRAGEITWATISGDTIALIYPPDQPRKILRSTNHGITWTRTNEDLGDAAKIALTPGALHFVQEATRSNAAEIEYRNSNDIGTSWQVDTMISTLDGYYSDLPTIATSSTKCGTEILTAWRDTKYGVCPWCFFGASIIARSAIAEGNMWLPENLLTDIPSGSEPKAAVDGGLRAVAWWKEIHTLQLQGNIRVSVSALSNHLSAAYNLATPDSVGAAPGAIAVSRHAIHIVWHQNDGTNQGTFRVYYRRGEFIPSGSQFSLSESGTHTFDSVEVTRKKVDTLTVTNSGTGVLVVGTAISDNMEFSVSPESTSISPASNAIFLVTFAPTSLGVKSGKVIFYHNGASSPDCIGIQGWGIYSNDTIYGYDAGQWNMVSSPVEPAEVTTLPSLFSYNGSYTKRDTMLNGTGYWARPESSTMIYRGVRKIIDTVDLRTGWNMVGTLAVPFPTVYTTIEPDSLPLSSPFLGYTGNGYVPADTLQPGRSYWVKAPQAVKLILDGRFLDQAQLPGSSQLPGSLHKTEKR